MSVEPSGGSLRNEATAVRSSSLPADKNVLVIGRASRSAANDLHAVLRTQLRQACVYCSQRGFAVHTGLARRRIEKNDDIARWFCCAASG